LNTLTRGDIRLDSTGINFEIYVHAPNKADDYIPVDDVFMSAWRLCEEWDAESRAVAKNNDEPSDDDPFFYLSSSNPNFNSLIKLTTLRLNKVFLPCFYKKWFERKVRDKSGMDLPLLYADGDPARPFWCDYSKMRNSFSAHLMAGEKNRNVVREVMRHRNESTTERFYLHSTRLDFAKKVQRALKPEAQMLVMGLCNAVEAGVSGETMQRAVEAGAVLPHGVCGSALQGDTCIRAGSCLECPNLVVIASRKPRFEADRDAYLRRAKELTLKGDVRGAENALSSASLCEAHIIRIEDTFGGGTDE
jgi:hypothetical protein